MAFPPLTLALLPTMKTNATPSLRFARIGEVSSATLRTEDLLSAFSSTLEDCITVNGAFLSLPENSPMRDRLVKLLSESQDAWTEDGTELQDEDNAAELVTELQDALNEFAAPYVTFGSHEGDGACFGFWPDVNSAREDVGFVSSKTQDEPDRNYRGEWLHVSDHGNATLYVREDNSTDAFAKDGSVDREIWSVV